MLEDRVSALEAELQATKDKARKVDNGKAQIQESVSDLEQQIASYKQVCLKIY